MTKTGSPLTETERHTICHGLRVAADQFDRDALTVQRADDPEQDSGVRKVTASDRMARQFRDQAETTRRWADLIENAGEVIIR